MEEITGKYEVKGKFSGFERPSQNYSKLPHGFIDCLPEIESMAELKVVLYLLRHTWGFSEYGKPKRITTDEFMNGRKKRDGSRMDKGTGLAKGSVIAGLAAAVEHGFILVEVDETDKARIEKYYSLNMSDVQDLDTGGQDLDSESPKVGQRSEKETKERKKQLSAALQSFVDVFGKFYSQREAQRWEALYAVSGKDMAQDLLDWAFKKEIHLMNRAGLLDSLETAAKGWKNKQKAPPTRNVQAARSIPTLERVL